MLSFAFAGRRSVHTPQFGIAVTSAILPKKLYEHSVTGFRLWTPPFRGAISCAASRSRAIPRRAAQFPRALGLRDARRLTRSRLSEAPWTRGRAGATEAARAGTTTGATREAPAGRLLPRGDRATGTTRTGAAVGPRTEATSARSPPLPARRRGATTRGRRRARTAARACLLARSICKTSSTRYTPRSRGRTPRTRGPPVWDPGAPTAHPSARTRGDRDRARDPARIPRDPPGRTIPGSRTASPRVRRWARRLLLALSPPRPARRVPAPVPAARSRRRFFVRARARAR